MFDKTIIQRKCLEELKPILVANYTTLSSIGKTLPLDGYYLQTHDIFVPEGTVHQPIGLSNEPFTGRYQGNGCKIINLLCQGSRLALFDTIEDACIERLTLKNAIFLGFGEYVNIAPFVLEAKGKSQIKHINWLSGYVEITGQELIEGSVAGLIHLLDEKSSLINGYSNGELIRHQLSQRRTRKGLEWPRLYVSGLVYNNKGIILDAERQKITQGIHAFGIAWNNTGIVQNIKIGDVNGEVFSAGLYEENYGKTENIVIHNIQSEKCTCGLVNINKGSIKKVKIKQVSSNLNVYGLFWRNIRGTIEYILIENVSANQLSYGMGQLNEGGHIRDIQIKKIVSAKKSYGLVGGNIKGSHLEYVSIGIIISSLETEIYSLLGKNENSLLHHIYISSFEANLQFPEFVLNDKNIHHLFVSTKLFTVLSTQFTYLDLLDSKEANAILVKREWNLQNHNSLQSLWLWTEHGLVLQNFSVSNPYQEAAKLLAIFRSLLGKPNTPETLNIKDLPVEVLTNISGRLGFFSLSTLQREKIISYALNKETINDFENFERLICKNPY